MALDWEHGALAQGLECYRRNEFFEAHEYWESVWVRAAVPEQTFLQALIHVTVAFHHLQCGNVEGMTRQLLRAQGKLTEYPADFGGVRVDVLLKSIAAWLRELTDSDTVPRLPYPAIR